MIFINYRILYQSNFSYALFVLCCLFILFSLSEVQTSLGASFICYLSTYVCIYGFQGASTPKVIVARMKWFFYEYDGQWYPGMDGAYVFPTFVLQLRKKKLKKTSTRKSDPTGDRTRACYVRGNDVRPYPRP